MSARGKFESEKLLDYFFYIPAVGLPRGEVTAVGEGGERGRGSAVFLRKGLKAKYLNFNPVSRFCIFINGRHFNYKI